jgi:hypothetical protein
MKVVAIEDGPLVTPPFKFNDTSYERAYFKGEIFEVLSDSIERRGYVYLIIYHTTFGCKMSVDPKRFITLDKFRESRLEKVLI